MQLLEATKVYRELPRNIKDSEKELFSHALNYNAPATENVTFKNAVLFGNGVLMNKGKYVRESIVNYFKPSDYGKKFFLKSLFLSPKKILSSEKEFTLAFDYSSSGYFHWFAETLPRIYLYKKYFSGTFLLLAENMNQEYHSLPLQQLGIENIFRIKETSMNLVPRLNYIPMTAFTGNYLDPFFKEMSVKLSALRSDFTKGEKIYISRSKAARRKIINEKEVIDYLSSQGFAILNFEDLAFRDQIAAAYNCRYLISIHGAGLTNMMFMQEGTNVMELRLQNDATNFCYFSMASALKLNYYYQSCKANDETLSTQQADYFVDIDELKRNVSFMLH